jgi:hypothetical protein
MGRVSSSQEGQASRRGVELHSDGKYVARLFSRNFPVGLPRLVLVGRFKEDLWMIKYLKGFMWSDLMNQQLHHKKLRDQRLRQHVDFAKRQANFYLDNVEKQQEYEKRLEKKRKRPNSDEAPIESEPEVHLDESKIKRTFDQRDIVPSKEEDDELEDDFFAQVRDQRLHLGACACTHGFMIGIVAWCPGIRSCEKRCAATTR